MIDMKFTLVQLQIFVAVAELGSFSAAARSLDRAQSAVSHAVAQLEKHFGVVLFERGGRTPVLTAAGRAVLEEARRLLRQARELEATVEMWKVSDEQAQFSVVLDMLFPVDRLVAILAELQGKHPHLSLTVHTEARGAVTARLLDESCQLGVACVLLPELPVRLETVPIGHIDFVAVASPEHPLAQRDGPVAMDDLRRYTQIVLEDRSHLSTDQQVGVVGVNVWRIGGQTAKHSLLRSGFGWGSMPLHVVEQDLTEGRLVKLRPAHWSREVMQLPLYAVYPADRPPGPVTRDAISLLQTLAPGASKSY